MLLYLFAYGYNRSNSISVVTMTGIQAYSCKDLYTTVQLCSSPLPLSRSSLQAFSAVVSNHSTNPAFPFYLSRACSRHKSHKSVDRAPSHSVVYHFSKKRFSSPARRDEECMVVKKTRKISTGAPDCYICGPQTQIPLLCPPRDVPWLVDCAVCSGQNFKEGFNCQFKKFTFSQLNGKRVQELSKMATSSHITVTVMTTVRIGSEGKVIPLQARCGPEGGQRYSSTLP